MFIFHLSDTGLLVQNIFWIYTQTCWAPWEQKSKNIGSKLRQIKGKCSLHMPGCCNGEHCHFFHITVFTVCFFSTCDGFCRCQPQAGSHFKVDRTSKWVTCGRAWTWCTERERMMVRTIHFVTQGRKLIRNKTFLGSWNGVWNKFRAGTRNVHSRSNAVTSVTNECNMLIHFNCLWEETVKMCACMLSSWHGRNTHPMNH